MKLLDTFKKQLEKLGDLKIVWCTTFNLSIEFVETYILSAVLAAETPKNQHDFELFQLALTEKEIDFRIFCDKRFMDANQNKRTSIPVHGVSPVLFETFSKDSLFHPKVIYLEDKAGKKILGVGSSNLTISGWGRNQEVFSFFEVVTKDQYSSIREFINNLTKNVGIVQNLPALRKFPSEDSKWAFVHSFGPSPFPIALFEGTNSNDLMVWSPYLPKDLPRFITNLSVFVKKPDLRIHLVPDRIQGKYIRTPWTKELQELIESGLLTLYENPTSRHDSSDLCHAKVWKLGGKLAIGSWNFTGPGSNSLQNPEVNNVEAGVLIFDSSSWKDGVGKPISFDRTNFASNELIADESLSIPEDIPFDVHICFDWTTQQYRIDGQWNEGEVNSEYSIRLPCIKEQIRLNWLPRKKVLEIAPLQVSNSLDLLSERRFSVLRKGKVVFVSLLTEDGLPYRRAQAFETLDELLDAFIIADGPDIDEDVPFRLPIISDDNPAETPHEIVEQPESPSEAGQLSLFRLFQATNQYTIRLEGVKSLDELNRWVFSKPGCLLELVEKTRVRIASPEHRVFNWFLANEVKTLVRVAKKIRKKYGIANDTVPTVRWEELGLRIPSLPRSVHKGYVEMVQKECKYDR